MSRKSPLYILYGQQDLDGEKGAHQWLMLQLEIVEENTLPSPEFLMLRGPDLQFYLPLNF